MTNMQAQRVESGFDDDEATAIAMQISEAIGDHSANNAIYAMLKIIAYKLCTSQHEKSSAILAAKMMSTVLEDMIEQAESNGTAKWVGYNEEELKH